MRRDSCFKDGLLNHHQWLLTFIDVAYHSPRLCISFFLAPFLYFWFLWVCHLFNLSLWFYWMCDNICSNGNKDEIRKKRTTSQCACELGLHRFLEAAGSPDGSVESGKNKTSIFRSLRSDLGTIKDWSDILTTYGQLLWTHVSTALFDLKVSNSKALRTCTHINRNKWAPQTAQSVLRPPLCTTASLLMNPLNPSVSSLQWLTFSCLNIWSVDFHPVDRGATGTFTPGVQRAACLSRRGCFRVQHLHKSAVSVSWIRKHFESLMEIQIPQQPVGLPNQEQSPDQVCGTWGKTVIQGSLFRLSTVSLKNLKLQHHK